jgi:hypothetical protein
MFQGLYFLWYENTVRPGPGHWKPEFDATTAAAKIESFRRGHRYLVRRFAYVLSSPNTTLKEVEEPFPKNIKTEKTSCLQGGHRQTVNKKNLTENHA